MSKNPKDREKRRQQKAARQKATRGARLAAFRAAQAQKTAKRMKIRGLLQDGVSLPPLGDEEYLFWLSHGANFLASDSEKGIWSPIFEGIYEGNMPEPESIAHKVMDTYHEELEGEGSFGGVPRAVLAWTVTDRNIITIYKHEALRRRKEKDPECDAEALARTPYNPTVWAMMDKVKARSLTAGDEMDKEPAEATS